ncbi:META domain protein [Candidatus Nitrososphaera evergladensis SR1]|uniref:META domain protein n=1 Tax=Candidatus Nitrososphaera evergladensis SR1 TaxID=1459636 RepID=A0A075MS45_9ARCH|nr:META domain-containing protein [Candidatus Nitrososphaera evergladensis]AIF84351.1 META domain protein [Candidatus Nitrososphaera evergladensis SR1]
MKGNSNATNEELTAYAWQMRSFSLDGHDIIDVRDYEIALSVNRTQIDGRICNGFGGSVQYVNSSTIKGQQIAFTTALCTAPTRGPIMMEVEDAFKNGLNNGMTISKEGDTLVLKDVVTNSTFTYGKPQQ